MPKEYKKSIAGQSLLFRADRTLWWPAREILFIADLHAGKTEHLQRAGLAVPAGSLQADLNRLQAAIDELKPKRVIVLGDLFHSDINNEWSLVVSWCQRQIASIELVRGNHDRFINDEIFTKGGLLVHEEGLRIAPFTLRHHPLEPANEPAMQNTLPVKQYILCGHLHPVVAVRGPGRDYLRLTCFVIDDTNKQQIILPAFGSFTGGYKINRHTAGELVAIAPDFSTVLTLT